MTSLAVIALFQAGISTVIVTHCLIDIAIAIRELKVKP